MHGGIEWLVDAHDCVPARLRDRAAVLGLLDRIVAAMELHVVSTAVHVFPGAGGVTALYLLAESHLTIHTFPETGAATLNAYCCRPRAAAPWRALFGELLGAREVTATEHARGPSRTDRVRSAAQQGSESPCGEGPPEGGRT
jgi:S-adenosylmethionine decarboxylase